MERSLWVRLTLIAAMVLGAVWLLLPSVLEERTMSVDVESSTPKEKNTEAWFVTPGAVPSEATAQAVEGRLRAAGVAIERVVAEDDRVVVFLAPGTFKADVEKAVLEGAGAPGVDLYAPAAVGLDAAALPAAGPERDAAVGIALGAATLAEGAAPVVAAAPVKELEGAVVVTAAAPADAPTPLVAVKHGAVVGWVDAGTGDVPLHLLGADAAAAKEAVLAGAEAAPLPQPLERWKAPVAEEKPAEVVEGPKAWYDAYLPAVKLALGLDLQGGIDLTLQVDQDAAVVASLLRDRRLLADEGAKENKTIEAVRDRSRDALRVAVSEDEAALRDWVGGKLGATYVFTGIEQAEGKNWQVWEMTEQSSASIRDQAVEQNLETLRKRVDATGVKEPSIVKMSGGRINIQLPGVKDAQAATNAIGTQATLEFRMVDVDADEGALARYVTEAEKALPPDQFDDVELLNDWMRQRGYLPADRRVMFLYDDSASGEPVRGMPMLVKDDVELTGADIDNALVSWDETNTPYVHLQMKPRGAARFCDITTANVGKPFAIVLDEQIRSAPRINEAICGGSAQITMGGSAGAVDEANMLALVLRTGALTAPVDVGEVRLIGASLGEDAIRSGAKGALLGSLLVFAYMLVWYGAAGLIADIALAINVLMVFALLAIFGATLTLPGIAGVALTVGMAVDANIIIYERIREELRLGVTARKAVDAGFEKAFSAILDGNLTTAAAGVVLYSYGTGPIKGFAVTLLIGIVTTLISGLFVSRTLMDFVTRRADARLRI